MRISVLYVADCPNWVEAGDLLRAALAQVGQPASIDFVEVHDDAEAVAVRFGGSPTFTVDGIDLFDTVDDVSGLTCRVYTTKSGRLAGLPDIGDLVSALRKRVRA